MSWDSVDDWLNERVKHPEEIHRDSHYTVQHYLQLIQEELAELRASNEAWKIQSSKGFVEGYYEEGQ